MYFSLIALCAIILCILRIDEYTRIAADTGTIEVIVKAIEQNMDDSEICEKGAKAIQVIAISGT